MPRRRKLRQRLNRGSVFKADLTIAISAYKPIHIMKPCCAVCGKTVIADIGIEDEDFKALDSVALPDL